MIILPILEIFRQLNLKRDIVCTQIPTIGNGEVVSHQAISIIEALAAEFEHSLRAASGVASMAEKTESALPKMRERVENQRMDS